MLMTNYIFFLGRCREAMTFYQEVLGGELSLRTYKEMPGAGEDTELADRIMNSRLVGDGFTLMASDAPPDRYKQPQGFYITIVIGKTGEAERIFTVLSEGGDIVMPFQETFWSRGFGMLLDKFGIPWMISAAEVPS